MPTLSKKSFDQLQTCDFRLQRIVAIAIRVFDFTILEGHRGKELQDQYFREGKTKLPFPLGRHNQKPSLAVDLVPFPAPKTPEEWASQETALRFHLLAGVMKGVAVALGYRIRWGGDWNQNNLSSDERFKDFPHFEIVG